MELDSETIQILLKCCGRRIQNLVNQGIKETITLDEQIETSKKDNGIRSNNVVYDDFIDILQELANDYNSQLTFEETIPNLKKKIKYCKNPMERKMLEKELNKLYKESKRR